MAASSMKASLIAMLPTPGWNELDTQSVRLATYNFVPAWLTSSGDRLVHHIVWICQSLP
jgi:hypothetical protein